MTRRLPGGSFVVVPSEREKPNLASKFMSACYAAGTFLQMQHAELTEDEIREVTKEGDRLRDPLTPRAFDLAVLLLLVENSKASREAIREAIHGGASTISDDELWELGYFVENLAISTRCNQGLDKYLEMARRSVGTFTVEERRASVIEVIRDEDDPVQCIHQISRYERRFAGIDPIFARDVLKRVVLDDNPGGKFPDGSAKIGPTGAAAKLAVSVGAFGDTKERNSKAAFDHAWDVEMRKFAEQQKQAKRVVSEQARRNRKG